MVLDSGKKQYDIVREMHHGFVNDIVVGRDLQAAGNVFKTIWMVKDRLTAKHIIEVFQLEQVEKTYEYEECFLHGEKMCFVFPYEKERSLELFYGTALESQTCSRQQIWTQIVTACLTCGLPDSILYLILKQRQLQMGADGSIWFQYCLDLSEFNKDISLQECVVECVHLLEQLSRQEQNRNYADELLEKKLNRKSYTEFIGLYKDIRLITEQRENSYSRKRFKDILEKNKDTLYHILCVISCCLLLIVLVMFVFHIAFGDFSFYDLTRQPIKKIGTESLLQ